MSTPQNTYIVCGSRTPFFKAGSDARNIHAIQLGQHALSDALLKTGVPIRDLNKVIDEVIVGNTGTPSDAANISRHIALTAGLSENIPAYTVHRNCASAMESVSQAFLKTQLGQADIVVAGGTESMSQMPLIYNRTSTEYFAKLSRARSIGAKLSMLLKMPLKHLLNPRVAIMEGLTDSFINLNMGQTAEVIARDFNISREEQDRFALESHLKTTRATDEGIFKDEIAPMAIPPKFKKFFDYDTGVRREQNMEALKKLKTVFDRRNGSVTAGNASQITDGAAMLIICNDEGLKKLGSPKPLAKIKSFEFAGLDPSRMGLGPVFSTQKLMKKNGMQLKDFDLVELNEAFAAQVLGCTRAFNSEKFCQEHFNSSAMGEIDPSILNVNGGAISIGHPVGATGSRLILTLALEMQRKNKNSGLATLCIGGGQGGSMHIEAV